MRSNLVGKAWRAVWNMKKSLPLTLHLMKDSRVGRQYKIAFIFVTVGYLLFPYDFIFDFPFFGQLDDLAILLYMLNWFIQHTPKEILTEYGWKEGDVVGKKNKKKEKEKRRKTIKICFSSSLSFTVTLYIVTYFFIFFQ